MWSAEVLEQRIASLESELAQAKRRPELTLALVERLESASSVAEKAGIALVEAARDVLAALPTGAVIHDPAPSGSVAHCPEPSPRVAPAKVSGMPEGEGRVLTAVAQQKGGATRQQISLTAGYKRATRDAYLQRLRTKGYVRIDGALVLATPSGIKALGPYFVPLPTGQALREHWAKELPEGESKVFMIAVRAYPRTVSRDSVSTASGYKRATRDAYIHRLVTRQLLRTSSEGITAAHELFPSN
jgi:hypothetical protein